MLEEYKQLYSSEIEYATRLNTRNDIYLAIMTIIGSGELFLISLATIENIIYIVLLSLSIILFISCCIMFYKMISGYEMHYYPIKEMDEAIRDTYVLVDEGKITNKQAKKHIKNMKIERYLNDAIANRQQNILKANRQRVLVNFLMITFFSIVICFMCYYLDDITSNTNNEQALISIEEVK